MRTESDVRAFHRKFGHPCPSLPRTPDPQWIRLRKRLIREEARELCEAIDSGNLVKIARECIDLVYVAVGTMVAYGLPMGRCWAAVQKANMAKLPAPPGEKPRKPPGWVSPDVEIEEVISEANARVRDGNAIHGLLYALPFSLLFWAAAGWIAWRILT